MTEIYLDSAATSLHKPPQVAQAVAEAICKAGNAARGAHGASLSALRTVYDTRCLAARLLGCPRPDHVVFAANSTMALNIAICGLLSPGTTPFPRTWSTTRCSGPCMPCSGREWP